MYGATIGTLKVMQAGAGPAGADKVLFTKTGNQVRYSLKISNCASASSLLLV